MATYLILNVAVMAVVGVVILRYRAKLDWPLIAGMGALLLILTVIFDSLLIHFGVMIYATSHITNIFVGKAPIEDLAYTVVAVVIVPYIWSKLGGKT